jgi:hypothetical protein
LKTTANRVTFRVLAQLGGLECNGLGNRRPVERGLAPLYGLSRTSKSPSQPKISSTPISPFQCEYAPGILEGKQQRVADISVTVSNNEAQQILT